MFSIFHLQKSDVLFGVLREYEVDQPWIYCKFEPTEHFSELKPLFDAELEACENGDYEKADEFYYEFERMNLKLIPIDSEERIKHFLLHIKDDEAWFRFILEGEEDW